MGFWILTIWHLLGSVLWLLQHHWAKQSPPSGQCHWWDWTVVAEPSSLQGDCLQWSECHSGPWTGEITLCKNRCLPADTSCGNNDSSVVSVRHSAWMLQREEEESFLLLLLLCSCEISRAICARWQSTFTAVKWEICCILALFFFFMFFFSAANLFGICSRESIFDFSFSFTSIPKV